MIFRDRQDAGRQLARWLQEQYTDTEAIVLALPRGGVPVGYEIAHLLNLPMDVFIVRKIGAPAHPELAVGAIAPGNVKVLNQALIRALDITESQLNYIIAQETEELGRRIRLFRGNRPFPALQGKTVILVDDGLATGSTALAAIQALRQAKPAKIVLAVPVSAPETVENLSTEVDELICLEMPTPFGAVGLWYQNFTQTSDEEVIDLLNQSWQEHPSSTR